MHALGVRRGGEGDIVSVMTSRLGTRPSVLKPSEKTVSGREERAVLFKLPTTAAPVLLHHC